MINKTMSAIGGSASGGKKGLLIAFAILFLAGCAKIQPIATNLNQAANVNANLIENNQAQLPVTTEEILAVADSGQQISEIPAPNLSLPSDINSGQIEKYFKIKDIYLALVLRPSMNIILSNLPVNSATSFVGILAAREGDSQWLKLTAITDDHATDKNNPYYLWTKGYKLFFSVVDQNGAGSGEGIMKLLTIGDKGMWQLENCYYFGTKYRDASQDGDYFAFSQKLDKLESEPLINCNNLKLNGPDQLTVVSDFLKDMSTHGAMIKDETAYDQNTFVFNDGLFLMYPLGRVELMAGKEQIFKETNKEAIFRFKDNSQLEVIFPKFPLANQIILSYIDENSQWFQYTLVFPYDETNQVYLADSSGHESITQYKYFDGQKMIDLNKKMQAVLGSKFKGEYNFPNFSLEFSPSYIRFTEQNYCCDTTYNTEDSNRVKYRKIFILDRKTYKILEEDKVAR